MWLCAVAGTWGPSVRSVPPRTFHPPDLDAGKLLESFPGFTPRVEGGMFPWVTGSWSRDQEQVAARVCRRRGSRRSARGPRHCGGDLGRPLSPKAVRNRGV